MAGASFDRKVAKAFAKVGKKVGYACTIYRPDTWVNPLQDRNILKQTTMSWSEDESFAKNPEALLTYFTLYTDYSSLELGDILTLPALSRTFIVTEITPIRGSVGVQCNNKADVLRPVFDMTADKKSSFNAVMTEVPLVLEYKSASQTANALQGVSAKLGSGQSTIEAWTWVPPGSVQLNDVLEVNGLRFQVTSVSSTEKGTFISGISTKVGK